MNGERVRARKELTKKDVANIEENYDMKVLGQKTMLGGMRSNTLNLTTNQGEKVAKIYPSNFTHELVNFQAQVCNYLNSNGVPSPKIYINKNGELTTPIEETTYILMERLNGSSPSLEDPNIIEIMYGPLASSLTSLSKFEYASVLVAPEIEIPIEDQIEELKQAVRKKDKPFVDPIVWEYQEKLGPINQEIMNKLRKLETYKQLIFGDYNLGSVLVNEGKASGIVDFDLVHEQRKGFDFMHLTDILFIDKQEGVKLEQRVNWNKLRKAMEFYSTIDTEIGNEIESFPLMHQLLGLRNLLDIWGNYYCSRSDGEYFERKKHYYLPRIEIPSKLEQRLIDTLHEGYEESR